MATTKRHWPTAALILAALVVGAGCNLSTLPFLWDRVCGNDSMEKPEMLKLADEDKDKLVKVLILTHEDGVETRGEFLTADQDLASALTENLVQMFKANKENVSIMPASFVRKYKNEHPDWYMDLPAVGKHFKADYVVYIELANLSLYQEKSYPPFYRGQADVSVTAYDLHHPDQDEKRQTFREQYPPDGPRDATDYNSHQFYQLFVNDTAQHLARFFAAHPYDVKLSAPN
jgi:hypothetical protein